MIRIKPAAANHGSIRDAIALNAWVWCDAGQHIVREREMRTADCCESCYYEWDKKEGGENDIGTKQKEQGDQGLPIASGERERETVTPKGPIQLCLSGD